MSENDAKDEGDCNEEEKKYPPTALGWVVRIFSLALFLGMLAIIGWRVVQPEKDIRFEVTLQQDDVRSQNGSYLAPIQIKNLGSRTAHDLEMELTAGGTTTQVDVMMLGQEERITYVIATPERPTSVEHRIISYEAP